MWAWVKEIICFRRLVGRVVSSMDGNTNNGAYNGKAPDENQL